MFKNTFFIEHLQWLLRIYIVKNSKLRKTVEIYEKSQVIKELLNEKIKNITLF